MKITVQVKPGSTKGPLVEVIDEKNLVVYLRERAVDGAANEALVRVLAKHFGLAKSKVIIETGFSGRIKRIRLEA